MDRDVVVNALLTENIHKPFEWGYFDCAKFTFMVADAISGSNLVERFDGKWDSKESCYKYIGEQDLSVISVLKELGTEEVEWGREITGDFYCMSSDLAHQKQWQSAGIVYRGRLIVMTRREGLCLIPMKDAPRPEIVLRVR